MSKTSHALFLIVAILALPYSNCQAGIKEAANKGAFEKGTKTIGIALGLGSAYNFYDYYGYVPNGISRSPSAEAIYDQGIISNAGPGTIGIGGILSYKTATYKYGNGDKDRLTNLVIGLRGSYHLTLLKNKNNKFDPYGGVTAGMRISRYTDNYSSDDESDLYPLFGIFVGARYNFSKNFGVFSELGYDVAILKIGLALTL